MGFIIFIIVTTCVAGIVSNLSDKQASKTGADENAPAATARLQRLGIDYETHDLEPQKVEAFAKGYRVIGVISVLAIIACILSADDGNASVVISLIVVAAGWRYRFLIGTIVGRCLFFFVDLFRLALKKV